MAQNPDVRWRQRFDNFKQALAQLLGAADDGAVWMEMLECRNASTHTYDEATADSIAQDILAQYVAEFEKLRDTLNKIGEQEDQ